MTEFMANVVWVVCLRDRHRLMRSFGLWMLIFVYDVYLQKSMRIIIAS